MSPEGLALNWPTSALVFGLIALLLFRPQLKAMLERSKKIGPSGWEGQEPPQLPAPPKEDQSAQEFFRSFENALVREHEERIRTDMSARKLETPADREKALLKSLALTQIGTRFELAYRGVYASQLALLVHLNAHPDGLPASALQSFYEDAAKAFPFLYENYSFDGYLSFLESYGLITRVHDMVHMSLAGREFLKYIVDTRKALPTFG